MAGAKRKRLTTDDLMRLQEGHSKRNRPLSLTLESEDELSDGLNGSGQASGNDAEGKSEGENGSEGGEDALSVIKGSVSEEEDDGGEDYENGRHESHDLGLPSGGWLDDGPSHSRMSLKRNVASHSAPLVAVAKSATFAALGISPTLISTMSGMAIRAPTEIQAACIPPLLAGKNLYHL
jgi:ATP-dependent RNA helicase DDX49/DBP8